MDAELLYNFANANDHQNPKDVVENVKELNERIKLRQRLDHQAKLARDRRKKTKVLLTKKIDILVEAIDLLKEIHEKLQLDVALSSNISRLICEYNEL